ncbi:MAG: hypothetical protein ACPGJS_04830 [Flammeovirgaceae bacterium]
MKKTLFAFLLCLCATFTWAQSDYITGRFYEGYIIKKDGTQKRGLIQYLAEPARYEKVIFKASNKAKKEKYTPKNLGGYKVADVLYHAIQYEDVVFKSQKFLALEKDGCLKQYYHRQYSQQDAAWNTIMILVNGDKAISTQTFVLKYTAKMSELVKDNKELANKIKNKEDGYGLLKIEKIVDEYNSSCNK